MTYGDILKMIEERYCTTTSKWTVDLCYIVLLSATAELLFISAVYIKIIQHKFSSDTLIEISLENACQMTQY